jgi:hypothetical protein
LLGGQEAGRSSTEVELDGLAVIEVEVRAGEVHFPLEGLDIDAGLVPVTSDDRCAGAEPAERFAKGKVKVQRERRGGLTGFPEERFRVFQGDELEGGRIGGIPGTGAVVFGDQVACGIEGHDETVWYYLRYS